MAIEPIGDLEQLALELEGIESVEDDDRGRTPEEMRQVSEAARIALENNPKLLSPDEGKTRWLDNYLRLVEMGYRWRVAAYIAWAAVPKAKRWPRTQEELATQFLGLTSDRVFGTWRAKFPMIDSTISMMSISLLGENDAEVIDAWVTVAKMPVPKAYQDRRMYLEQRGIYNPRTEITVKNKTTDDIAEYSEAELVAMAKKLKKDTDG